MSMKKKKIKFKILEKKYIEEDYNNIDVVNEYVGDYIADTLVYNRHVYEDGHKVFRIVDTRAQRYVIYSEKSKKDLINKIKMFHTIEKYICCMKLVYYNNLCTLYNNTLPTEEEIKKIEEQFREWVEKNDK